MLVPKNQLAEIFGVSAHTIRFWIDDGLPVVERTGSGAGRHNQYDTHAVTTWLENRAAKKQDVIDYNEERARKTKLEADKLALDLLKMQRELIHVDDIERAWGSLVAAFRARVLSLPSRIASQVLTMTSAFDVEAFIRQQVYEALSELSKDAEYDPEEGEAVSSPAPKPDRKPMGRPKKAAKPGE